MPDNEENKGNVTKKEVIDSTAAKVVEEITDAHPSSGLAQQLAYYLPKPGDKDYVAPEGDKKPEEKVVDGFTSEEMASLNTLLEEEKPDFTTYSEENLVKIKAVFPERFEVKEDLTPKFEDMDAPTLIEEVKKNQRFVSERDTKIKTLETEIETAKKATPIPETEYQQFVKEARTNLSAAWNKFKDKFDLPNINLVASVDSANMEDRLLQWQKTDLRDTIEKEFGLEKGEFEVVKEDLFTPKTASYRWRTLTQSKEQELQTEISTKMTADKASLEEVQVQQQADIEWYAKTYLNDDKNLATNAVIEMNAIPGKIAAGEMKSEDHPFSVRNLLRGVNHEVLAKADVDAAVKNLTAAFNAKGIFLEAKDFPADITATKGTAPVKEGDKLYTKEQLDNSPMLRSVMDHM